ncbi:unnamed protein product [Bursaphelenchus xylophilus]|uniref:(pine wood nematode) hypothetical protein n=1 Tax=Bursaphelenchus xylophilus TaxID=6326 RepID=A0A1I7SRR9_BURXY|nr:unnamed protein product [Bursaphelenchus xylophilus]CAG9101918.1 unnamed protein product [Bursaphelenchus xylophilus]
MDYKKLASDTEPIYSQTATVIKGFENNDPPPTYKKINTPKVDGNTRWRRFLATKVTVRHVLLALLIYWSFCYIDNCAGITSGIKRAIQYIGYNLSAKIGELFNDDDKINTFSKWSTREHGIVFEEERRPVIHGEGPLP